MKQFDLSAQPSARTLRQFAGLCLIIFGAVAGWQFLVRERPALAAALAILAVGIGVPGLVKPRAVHWIYVGWMAAVSPVGWVVSWLILGLLYFGVFTPLALVFRVRGRDLLRRRRDPEWTSYWLPKASAGDLRAYFHQS